MPFFSLPGVEQTSHFQNRSHGASMLHVDEHRSFVENNGNKWAPLDGDWMELYAVNVIDGCIY
jgi:hypothetical protein